MLFCPWLSGAADLLQRQPADRDDLRFYDAGYFLPHSVRYHFTLVLRPERHGYAPVSVAFHDWPEYFPGGHAGPAGTSGLRRGRPSPGPVNRGDGRSVRVIRYHA